MLKKSWALVLLLALSAMLMCGCVTGEYKTEIEEINNGVEMLGDLKSGHVTVTTEVAAENGDIAIYDAAYQNDYYYNIVIKTFNYVAAKRDMNGNLLEPAYYVVNAEKFDLTTEVQDEEYDGSIGDFPDLLSFFFGAGLKTSYVGTVEKMTDEAHPDWQGYHVVKSDKYVERVNQSRTKHETDGTMLSSYVDYWLDAAGVLVKMDYVSRDAVTEIVGADENGEGGEAVEDVINQRYLFEMVTYNDNAITETYPQLAKETIVQSK